jgi:hypothetical protein
MTIGGSTSILRRSRNFVVEKARVVKPGLPIYLTTISLSRGLRWSFGYGQAAIVVFY